MPAMSIDRAAARRAKQIAAIHVLARKRLRLDESTYRDLLERVAGVRSAADLDAAGRARVLAELRRLTGEGARQMRNAVPAPGAPAHVREEISAMVGKVGAILAESGRSWAYAHGLARRMFKVQRVEWLHGDQLHRLIAALEIDQRRRGARERR